MSEKARQFNCRLLPQTIEEIGRRAETLNISQAGVVEAAINRKSTELTSEQIITGLWGLSMPDLLVVQKALGVIRDARSAVEEIQGAIIKQE
ncbi:MAG: hypothetical protein Q7S61_03965 [bacterium]|nr:hypothetical protein [bacterium]